MGSVQLAVSIAAMAVAAPFVVAESIAVLFHDLPLLDTSWAKVVVPAALTAFLLFLGMQSRAPGPPSLLVALVAFAGIVVERWVREHRNPPSGAR